jgi:hypothetical protein
MVVRIYLGLKPHADVGFDWIRLGSVQVCNTRYGIYSEELVYGRQSPILVPGLKFPYFVLVCCTPSSDIPDQERSKVLDPIFFWVIAIAIIEV